MPPTERERDALRESQREAERILRHQHSASSDQGRALIPMWDSSDPERAPPPLPLHPQSPSVGTSRSGTSSAIQSAHAALTEKARESALVSHALAKRMSEVSPERSPTKSSSSAAHHSHRRMQSLQPGSVRDLSMMLETGRDSNSSTPRSPEKSTRPSTPSRNRDRDPFTDEKNDKAVIHSPIPGPSLTPILRPTVRRPHQSILGENTPPQSATMLALHNMATPTANQREREMDAPLSNVTNGSTALVKVPPNADLLSTQILSLTSIATALQKEMAQLSRRSRDNATDLFSLKEATNARDEDIRKCLRELITNAHEAAARSATRDAYGGSLLLDNKPHGSSPRSMSKAVRPFSLPRIPSPTSFAASMDRDSVSTPSLYGSDAPTTIHMLEKILRDMGTKQGQESLMASLSEVIERIAGMASAEKVEDLLHTVRASQDQSIVPTRAMGAGNGMPRARNFSFEPESPLELEYQRSGPMTQRVERLLHDKDSRRSSAPSSRSAGVVNDDILNIIRTVKDSVAQGGGLTAEVKALVRELRGEVLGMGREIGRRLDEAGNKTGGRDRSATASDANVTKVVEEGLEEMKQHMNHLLREHRRQSATSTSSKASAVDYQEIYNAVRAALKDSPGNKSRAADLSREDVVQAVREAWETYKPEIEVQQIGLERDEVLEVLKEGLHDYTPRGERSHAGANKEEVFKAVVEGLKHFVPPRVDTAASLSRDEILGAVRECLEEFEFPVAPSAMGAEITKDEMVDAVKIGLSGFDFPRDGAPVPRPLNNDEIVLRLREIMEYLREEFKFVSEEAKQNVAANGRDTEQVLDATKDGLEKLRVDIEGYVDRATGAASHEEFMEGLVRTLDVFREEIASLLSEESIKSQGMLKGELESMRETVNSSMVPLNLPGGGGDSKKVLEALQEGINSLRTEITNRPVAGTSEVLDALQEGLSDLRKSIDRLGNKPTDLTANDEILDALKSGLNGVRSDIDGLRDQSRAVATVENGAVVPAEILKHDDIKKLEVLIAEVNTKVEAMESSPSPAESVSKENIVGMEEALRNLQETVAGMNSRGPSTTDAASREDVEAIETILRNTKARLDDLIDGEQAVRKDHIDAIETHVLEAKENLSRLNEQVAGLSSREDISMVEALVAQVANGFDEMKDRHDKHLEEPERVTKGDVGAIEDICIDMKTVVEQMVKSDIAALPTRDDLKSLETIVKEFKDRIESHAKANTTAFEERQAETVGVGERVTEVKEFLEEFQALVKDKLADGSSGLESLGKLLETVSDTVGNNATVGVDLKEMFETMKAEFEESRAGVVGAKLESDEKIQQTTDVLSSKMDERFDELVSKYDEFQTNTEERAKAGEARDIEMEAAMVGTKAVADELKLLIDTLGSAVTDSLERMEEASKTVFSRVEDLMHKSDENHSDGKAEHELTREQVKHALGVVEGVQGHVVEYQPKILETIKDVLLIVGQHYDHSKASVTTIQEKIEEAKPPEQPLLPEVEKYDDTGVHEKLDKLVDRSSATGKALEQLETLDKVHNQVRQTAADISEFISAQTQRIADEHEDREKTLQETTVRLERRLAEKEQAESSVAALREEEGRLRESILGLRADSETLGRQKTRLTADVSSLETALRLRREELHHMETRAEGLERRILEGVMDHSRVLLMAKATNKGRDVMNRKRVPSTKPSAAAPDSPHKDSASTSKPRAAFNMALSSNRNLNPPAAQGAARRILSLSQINHNVPAGGFKRSQSVRNAGGVGALRKSSWAAGRAKGYGDLDGGAGGGDKENDAPLKESDEEGAEDFHTPREEEEEEEEEETDLSIVDSSDAGGGRSRAGTLRRSSLGTSVVTGMTGTTDGTYSEYDGSEWTESHVGAESMVDGGEGNEVVLFQG